MLTVSLSLKLGFFRFYCHENVYIPIHSLFVIFTYCFNNIFIMISFVFIVQSACFVINISRKSTFLIKPYDFYFHHLFSVNDSRKYPRM